MKLKTQERLQQNHRKRESLNHRQTANGYHHVKLSKDGKVRLFKVHVIVAMAFLGYTTENYDRKDSSSIVIDHIDGDKKNNALSNLQLLTQRENVQKYYGTGRFGIRRR